MAHTILVVLNLKGGAGKTTVTAALGSAWSATGHNVLVVDSDPQASLLSWQEHAAAGGKASVPVTGLGGQGLRTALPRLAHGFDVVIIDTPPRLAVEARAALMVCSAVLIPVTPGATDLWALAPTLHVVEEARTMRDFAVFGLMNRSDRRVYTRTMATDVMAMGLPLLESKLRNYDAFPSAMLDGETVISWAPKTDAAADVRRVARELASRMGIA